MLVPPKPAPPPWSEAERLAELHRYAILDTPPEAAFDDLTRLAADLLGAPIAAITLIDAKRQWFKAQIGIDVSEMPVDLSLCAQAILARGGVVVPDTTLDPRFNCNPLVTGEPGLRFYAGEPLLTPGGLPLGMLCVLDTQPRPAGLTPQQQFILRTLANQVMTQLSLRRAIAQRDTMLEQQQAAAAALGTVLNQRVAERSAQLSASETLFRLLFGAIPDLLLLARVTDDDVVYEAVNPAVERFTGRTAEQIIGRSASDIIPEPPRAGVLARYRQCVASGVPVRYEVHVDYQGNPRTADTILVPLPADADAGPGRLVLGSTRDITDQRRLEEQLLQAQKMEAVGQLTGGLAHDFNNLLTGIVGSLNLMRTRIGQGRTGDLPRYIDAAEASAQRAAALTHRLLAFSRRQTLDPRPTALRDLVVGMRDLLAGTIGPTVQLEIDVPDDCWTILCDPNQLENALLNLAINARDAMAQGGRLTIRAENRAAGAGHRPIDTVCIAVGDTGVGIPPELVERVFDPFFTTKPVGAGTGLGLSMVYGFAKQSGGEVRLRSTLGTGTVVSLHLPRHHGPVPAIITPLPHQPATARPGHTVLVVDDESVIRMLAADALGEAGFTVMEAADGPSALDILRSPARIDVLITDVGLPNGMNGRELADAALALRPGLNVLFITGYAENAAVGNGRMPGAMQLITKPFTMDALLAKVGAMIGTVSGAGAPPVTPVTPVTPMTPVTPVLPG